jgi:hypothetical protein
MLPVGVLLTVLAAVMARRAWKSWQRLALRLDDAARALRAALRGSRPGGRVTAHPLPSWPSRILTLALALAVLQVSLYLLQENVEAMAVGMRAPGFSAITGVHWAASLIQLDVAFLVLALVTFVVRHFAVCATVIRDIEALLCVLAASLRPVSAPRLHPVFLGAPEDRLGSAMWSRPPPVVTATA